VDEPDVIEIVPFTAWPKAPDVVHLDLAHVHPSLDKLGVSRVYVGDDQLQSPSEPGGISTIPFATTIEQPDPGGVSWTMRISSLMVVSWSMWNPTLSA
jgi:hypothetical protein